MSYDYYLDENKTLYQRPKKNTVGSSDELFYAFDLCSANEKRNVDNPMLNRLGICSNDEPMDSMKATGYLAVQSLQPFLTTDVFNGLSQPIPVQTEFFQAVSQMPYQNNMTWRTIGEETRNTDIDNDLLYNHKMSLNSYGNYIVSGNVPENMTLRSLKSELPQLGNDYVAQSINLLGPGNVNTYTELAEDWKRNSSRYQRSVDSANEIQYETHMNQNNLFAAMLKPIPVFEGNRIGINTTLG